MSRIIKLTLLAIIAADVLFFGVVRTPVRLYALSAVGRSGCPLDGTLESFQNAKRMHALREEFQKGVHVAQRDASGLELWNTPRGQTWMPPKDHILPFLLSEQEQRIYGTGERGVHAGDVVLDCGANVGMFTRTALASGAGLVIAIEPAPVTLECLRRNLAKEIAQGRVIVYPKGVWDKDDFLDLTLNEGNAGENSVVLGRNAAEKVRVPLTTIDKIVEELHLTRVDFIKMDIEGAEKNALTGAHETLRRFRPRMAISSEHLPDDTQKIPALVSRLRPDYRLGFNACEDEGSKVEPMVLQFY